MENKPIIIYDFETNGFWSYSNQPIQVYFKTVWPDGKIDVYSDYVTCKWKLSPTTIRINGITDEILLKRGRPIEEVFGRIKDILFNQDSLLIGHNILRFDNYFLNYYLQKFFTLKYQVPVSRCFDTAAEFKAMKMGIRAPLQLDRGGWHQSVLGVSQKGLTYKLNEACQHYGVPYLDAHTAGGDVEMTHQVFLKQTLPAVTMPVVAPKKRGRHRKVA